MSKARPLPAQDFLREVFTYCSKSGELRWARKTCRNMRVQRVAGYVGHQGYRVVTINKIPWQAHRLIWKLVYGEEPRFIDHIDGDKSNNRLSNLRECSQAENNRNCPPSVRNKTGVKGLSVFRGKWRARVVKDGKELSRCFDRDRKDEAINWLIEKRVKLHGDFANLLDISEATS